MASIKFHTIRKPVNTNAATFDVTDNTPAIGADEELLIHAISINIIGDYVYITYPIRKKPKNAVVARPGTPVKRAPLKKR